MTLAATVREAARRFGDAPAVVAPDGDVLTFDGLDRRSDALAARLGAAGVVPGDLVALLLPSGIDYVVAYAAIAKRGAAAAGVNPRYTAAERSAVLAVAAPRLVLATDELADGVAVDAEVVRLDRLPAGDAEAAPATPPDPDAPVAVVFTSGTTGVPRGAVFGARQLHAIGEADAGTTWGGGPPVLGATEMAHVGFMTKLPWYLRRGGALHLIGRWRAPAVLDLIERARIPVLGGVAPQLALLLAEPDLDQRDLGCIEAIVMGGAHSPPALVDEARRRLHAPYSIRYSSTESGGIGTGTAFDADDDEALHSVGRPRGRCEATVRDIDGQDAPPGEVGELFLRSPYLMQGYWRDPEATRSVLDAGWLATGDLARIDDRGLVRLAGRRKEMYVRGGYNVYPLEVEATLSTHPAVREVAVVPRPDPVMGEIGVAVVAPRPGTAPPTLDDLRAHAAARLAAFKLPEALEVVERLPRTAMDKVDRSAVRAHVTGSDRHTGRRSPPPSGPPVR